jgi:26S proteasome regulatory subunit N5
MKYLDSTPDEDAKIALVKTLKDICEGKMYVEGESARLHLMLANIYESRGDIAAACDMIQDVHVETYGSLSKKEKAEYILHQIRLNLLRKDFVRALIQSRKMNRKVLEEADMDSIKVSFYRLMIDYYTFERFVNK